MADTDRALALLERHGWNATSFQILEPGLAYRFDGADACAAYVDTGRAWVVAGAPVAPEERLAEVAGRVAEAAARAGRRVSFFAVEERFLAATRWPSVQIGEQPVWDPRRWDETLRASRGLREQLRRARAKGVRVRRLSPAELEEGGPARLELEALVERWLGARQMAPMGFLVQVHPFSFPRERRTFVAERDGRIVAFLGAVPIYARGGWLLEDLLRDPAAPNGTSELLVDAAFRAAAAEGCAYATLGLAPLAGSSSWLRAAGRLGRGLYDFAGLRAFKARLRPDDWEPIHLAHPPGGSAVASLHDALAAFARGGLLRFGARTLLRVPAVVIEGLALLLVPWTIALALAPARFFPGAGVRWAWVAFDVALAVALFRLARRWSHRLATSLATLVTADAALTLAQVVAWNAPRVDGALDAAAVGLGLAAPAAAAALLWRARWHRRAFRAPGRA